jgi:hypothetical protein
MQIIKHKGLMEEHIEKEVIAQGKLPWGHRLRSEQVILCTMLVKLGYDLRLGGVVNDRHIAYAVHSKYIKTFDKGLFNKDTCTWDSSVGGVPEWALLEVFVSL